MSIHDLDTVGLLQQNIRTVLLNDERLGRAIEVARKLHVGIRDEFVGSRNLGNLPYIELEILSSAGAEAIYGEDEIEATIVLQVTEAASSDTHQLCRLVVDALTRQECLSSPVDIQGLRSWSYSVAKLVQTTQYRRQQIRIPFRFRRTREV